MTAPGPAGPTWGAIPTGKNDWRLGLWAPGQGTITLRLGDRRIPMDRDAAGWHHAAFTAGPGTHYHLEIGDRTFPDPAARQQADGVHGRSVLAAPRPPAPWQGRAWNSAVLLELHIGTFTAEGTLAAAARRIPDLAALGVTALSLMPLAEFEGRRGWGYDGVLPFALHGAYGTPDDLSDFIDTAHAHGLMVLIDAVYNHFGPSGNVLATLSPDFFDHSRATPWGAAIAVEKPPVRDFFFQNAAMWIRDYGADGLRLDAVHQIGAPGSTAFLTDLSAHVAALDLGRPVHLVTEDERNLASYTGRGLIRAQWNDDWHHAIHCLLTGEDHSYYAPFAVDPFGDLVTAMRDGQVDQGQPRRNGHPRGEPSGSLAPTTFVNANQTHDQIGNRARGERLISLAGPGPMQVVHAALLLSPYIPMLFMGEEEGARAPFLFFTDFTGDLARAVRDGRRAEFPEFALETGAIPDPNDPATFEAARPYADPAPDAGDWRALTAALLTLRHDHIVPLLDSGWTGSDATRLSDNSLRAEWRFQAGALSMSFTAEDELPVLPEGHAPIFGIAHDPYAICVGRTA